MEHSNFPLDNNRPAVPEHSSSRPTVKKKEKKENWPWSHGVPYAGLQPIINLAEYSVYCHACCVQCSVEEAMKALAPETTDDFPSLELSKSTRSLA